MSSRVRYKKLISQMKSSWISARRLQVFGSIPSPLYRAFSKLEYAEDFCKGNIRFQTLEYYKNTEDKTRVDMAEGIAEAQVTGEALIIGPKGSGKVVVGVEKLVAPTFNDSHFICCMSLPLNGKPSKELAKFGKYVVKVKEPIVFLNRIAEAIKADEKLAENPPSFEASKIVYDKGAMQQSKPKRSKINRLRWMQKPATYETEREYRLHFQTSTLKPITKDSTYIVSMSGGIGEYEIIEVSP
ncbi:hypothetical protein VIBNISO65_830019 [Vibrio nigripulchritudo SO65]|uniref:hypothetical protein n=1 Tax=Vibrio nigripulchritudo TaxID=28173 RepID=UPI0003B17BEB|nr:hypothetical protein [Vibrio nigripulchritudo]CCN38207.1 hypothetical protein VIBNIAM115_840019 [Vibrio nigripulchritudo AM115]CCN42685.1 hypothetical protein VIBNIFTn2_360019 [Vibrio nigripulchritudo FTn2]CCN79081.1 hypothetical protein VIBNISO65_830019 [Vibrio nigripulchritudo SO65]